MRQMSSGLAPICTPMITSGSGTANCRTHSHVPSSMNSSISSSASAAIFGSSSAMRLGRKAWLNRARISRWLGSSRPASVGAGTHPFSWYSARIFGEIVEPRLLAEREFTNRSLSASTARTSSWRVITYPWSRSSNHTGASSRSVR